MTTPQETTRACKSLGDRAYSRRVLYVAPSADRALVSALASAGWEVSAVGIDRLVSADSAERPYRVALMDLDSDCRALGETDGWLNSAGPHTRWIALGSPPAIERPEVQSLILRRFYDYHTFPIDLDRLLVTLGRAYGMASLREVELSGRDAIPDYGIIGTSDAVRVLRQTIRKVGRTSAPVLISGETGTGKELTARGIHAASERADGPFVAVNCGSIPHTLIQSELFGYEKGAFTGATQRRAGKIEAASGGTILLDEIGDLSLELQVNLLRFLEEGRIQRVGSAQETEVDVRVVAATHVDLWKAVGSGRFREDLYYRLNVLRIEVPPLRSRVADIQPLAEHFFERFSPERQGDVKGIGVRAVEAMRQHHWPGNVREMINRVRQAAIMSAGPLITPRDLGLEDKADRNDRLTLEAARNAAERQAIVVVLARSRNNLSEAARVLGVNRGTLYRLMSKHKIKALPDQPGASCAQIGAPEVRSHGGS